MQQFFSKQSKIFGDCLKNTAGKLFWEIISDISPVAKGSNPLRNYVTYEKISSEMEVAPPHYSLNP